MSNEIEVTFSHEELELLKGLGWKFYQTRPGEWQWTKYGSDGKAIGIEGDEYWRSDREWVAGKATCLQSGACSLEKCLAERSVCYGTGREAKKDDLKSGDLESQLNTITQELQADSEAGQQISFAIVDALDRVRHLIPGKGKLAATLARSILTILIMHAGRTKLDREFMILAFKTCFDSDFEQIKDKDHLIQEAFEEAFGKEDEPK